MARKLPWANPSTTDPNASASRPQKRQKSENEKATPRPDAKSRKINNYLQSDDATPTPSPSPRKPRSRPRPQSRDGNAHRGVGMPDLSSSPPPPGPPLPELDPMIEGLDGDDVYMMVEDEFYATAQTFTAHLHHAAYKRLMKEAREKKRRLPAVPEMEMQIPDDATRGVRDRLARRALEDRQRSGVKALVGGLLSSDPEDVEELDLELQKEEGRVNDPWAGTSLAPLMRYESNERVSLKGLERISGATRAAQGFGPSRGRARVEAEGEGEGDESGSGSRIREDGTRATRAEASSDLDGGARATYEAGESSKVNSNRSETVRSKASSTEQKRRVSKEKEMPAPSVSRPARENHRVPEPKLVRKEQLVSENKSNPALIIKSAKAEAAPKKYKSFINSLDDFDEDMFEQTQTQARATQRTGPASLEKPQPQPQIKREDKGKDKDKKDRSSRYDQIPIFLA